MWQWQRRGWYDSDGTMEIDIHILGTLHAPHADIGGFETWKNGEGLVADSAVADISV